MVDAVSSAEQPVTTMTPPRRPPCCGEPSTSPAALSPLPIAPTSTTSTPTPHGIKRRLRAHLRDSGVMDTILAQLRASLDGKRVQQPHMHVGEEEAHWRRKAERLEARIKELEAAAHHHQQEQEQEQQSRPETAAVVEERLRQEMEKGT